ncbi:MAG: fibronectin type III domain-containing protein [bacterium]|nr:fibronectin type III domain-containing protein [bacterium]
MTEGTHDSAVVSITDDDTAGLVAPSTLDVNEGSTATFDVKLATQPTADVTVSLSSDDSAAASVPAGDLTFTTGNWNTAQTVTVTGVQDADASDEDPTITLTATGGGYTGVTAEVEVDVDDDDTARLVVDKSSLPVAEGSTATFDVRLATQPAADVTVSLSSDDPDAASVPEGDLTFTTVNWNTAQTVTVTGVQDADSSDEDPTITLTASSTDDGYDGATAEVGVEVDDDETARLVVDKSSLPVTEGSTAMFELKLSARPSETVTVNIGSDDTAVASVNKLNLEFTTENWNTAQTVIVTGEQDDDAAAGTAKITATADPDGNEFDGQTAEVEIDVADDDTAGLAVDPPSLPVAEGSTADFQIRLATRPSASVTVTVVSDNTAAATVPSAALTFTTGNWYTAQAVTVTGVQDDDAAAGTAKITATAASADAGYDGETAEVAVDVEDDDTAALVAPATLEVDEGSTATFAVKLATQPTATVTVSLSSDDPGAASVPAGDLTFTTGNWNTAQTVTVTGVQDDDAEDEAPTITAAAASADTQYDAQTAEVEIDVDDDETAALLVSSGVLTVNENGTATFLLRLATQPLSEVEVTIASDDESAVAVPAGTVRFTTGNWATDQTIAVVGLDDADASNESVRLVLIALGGGYGGTSQTKAVSTIDDDTIGLVLNPVPWPVVEGETSYLAVQLATQPTTTVTVTLELDNTDVATMGESSLTFTTANWNQPQSVPMTGVEDDDGWDATATVTLTSASGDPDYDGLISEVPVNVDDDEIPRMIITPQTLELTEGSTGTFTAQLSTRPRSDVLAITNFYPQNPSIETSGSITFIPDTWNIPITVTVRALQDNDASDETLVISNLLLSQDPGYRGAQPTQDVFVDDDDTAGLVAPATVPVTEGSTATFDLALATEPEHDVSVTVTSDDTGAVSVTGSTLTFTPSDWNVAQTVTVTGVQDDDIANETATLTVLALSTDQEYTAVTAVVAVSVDDNDDAGLTVDPSSLPVAEGGTADFEVRLDSQPTADVSVTVASDDIGAVTVPSTTLTFTATDWNTAQTVTVTALQDDDGADESVEVTATASSTDSDYSGQSADVTVTVDDDETANLLVGASSLTLAEGGTASFGVRLATRPLATVTVTVVSDDTAAATVPPQALIFTPVDWNTLQTVAVTGVQDDDAAADTATITATAVSADSGYNGATAEVDVSVSDDDTAEIVVNPSSLPVAEGSTATFEVSLATRPSGTVTVSLTTDDPGAASVPTGDLTFTTGNWDTAQTVTVTGVQDDDAAAETAKITATAASADTGYDGATAEVAVSVSDDDTAEIVVNPSSLPVAEGSTASFEVSLATRPSATVTVTVASDDTTAATVPAGDLTFTTGNWDTAQTVTVTAVQDADAAADTAKVTAAAASADPDYNGATAEVDVNIIDDDTPGLVAPASLKVAEGSTASFEVSLATQPTAAVTVALTSDDPGAASVPAGDLIFTTGNWDTAQTVTVTAVQDADAAEEDAVITLTASDGGYSGQSAEVDVEVADDDTAGLVAPATLEVAEGSTATFQVRLATQPSAVVTVSLSSDDPDAASVPAGNLTFTTGNWNTAQTVTVTAAQDDDAAEEAVTVTATASSTDADYDGATAEIHVDVADDDTEELLVGPSSLPISEGSTATFDVWLATQPSATVVVTVSSDDAAASVPTTALTFTTTNWDQAQTVTVTAVQDDDASGDTATITATAASADADYDAAYAEVAVAITDDETAGLIVNPTSVPIAEGGTAQFAVSLATRPRLAVQISLTSDDPSSVSAPGSQLTFTELNWSVPQTVTLTGVEDLDAASESTSVQVTVIGWDAEYLGLSEQVAVSVTDNDGPPGVPVDFKVIREVLASVAVGFGPPTSGAPVVFYTMRWREGTSGAWILSQTASPAVVANQMPGTQIQMQIRGANEAGPGPWTPVLTAHTDDCAASATDSCSLALGGSETGRINVHDTTPDRDWYRVSLESNKQYRIDAKGDDLDDQGGSLGDPSLAVYDNTGTAVSGATDNDGGSGQNAMLLFTPATTGDYFVEVSEHGGQDHGTYTVSATLERAPTFTSSKNLDLTENLDLNTQVTATDQDAGDIILGYEVSGGADRQLFAIDSGGNLTMTITPNFDAPVDANRDNTYEVELTAYSGPATGVVDGSTSELFRIEIQNLPDEKPAAPSGLHVRNEFADKIEIAWNAPTNSSLPVTFYGIETASSGKPTTTDASARESQEIIGLDAGTEYEFRVRATNSDGQGQWSDWVTGYTDECGQDTTSACVPDLGADSVFRINQRSDQTQPDVDWYKVTSNPPNADSFAAYQVTVKGDESSDHGGTLPDPALDVYNSDGTLDANASQGADDGGIGRNAQALIVVHGASKAFYLGVSAQHAGNATSVTGTYTIRVEQDTGPVVLNGTDLAIDEHTTLEHQVQIEDSDPNDTVTINGILDLDDGQLFFIDSAGTLTMNFEPDYEHPEDDDLNNQYEFWVSYTNHVAALGPLFNSTGQFRFLLTINDVSPEPPSRPVNVLITNESATSVTINRGEARPLSSAITSYEVRIAQARDDGQPLTWTTTDIGMAVSHTFSPLTPKTSYNIETRAVNDDGGGPWSQTVVAATDDCGDAVGANVCILPDSGIATGRIGITRVGSDVDVFSIAMHVNHLYRIDVKGNNTVDLGGTLPDPEVRILDASGMPISGATDDDGGEGFNARLDFEPQSSGTYHVEVVDSSGTDSGTYTLVVSVHDAPPMIRGSTTPTLLENTALEHQLDIVDNDSSDTITAVAISGGADRDVFSIDSNNVLSMSFVPDFENPQSDSGDNVYHVEITVTSQGNRGLADRQSTYSFTVTVTDSAAEVPTRASHSIAQQEMFSYKINWSPPDDNGVAITSYQARIATTVGTTWTTVDLPDTAREHTFTGLSPGTNYRTQVRAINANGAGAWSLVLEGRTDRCSEGLVYACQTTVGATETGWIDITDGPRDKDWWGVALVSGKRYRISVENLSGLDPKVKLFWNTGFAVAGASDDNSGTGNDALLVYDAPRSRLFYIEVRAASGETGEYRLTITEDT